MPLLPMHEILRDASRNGYAVGAFNIVNLEFLEAIVESAEALRSPVILSIAEVHFPYVNLDNVCPLIVDLAKRADAPIALHLDHGVSRTAFLKAIRHGFTSVMFDGSKLSFEDNVAQTRQMIEMCRPLGISVEAELGAVGGDEGDGLGGQADPSLFTDPQQAKTFVEQTGIDALAVAIGNVHGKYRGEPQLDFTRLERINELCGVPLVLHGGSGISEADFRRAISLGIAKINFYTGMSQAALAAASPFMTEGRRTDYTLLMQAIKKAVAETVAEQMRIFGSSGKWSNSMKSIDYWHIAHQFFGLVEAICDELERKSNAWVVSGKTITVEDYDEKTKWSDHSIGIPLLFNFYHGIELTLKGFLVASGRKPDTDHRLTNLLKKFEDNFPGTRVGLLISPYVSHIDGKSPIGRFISVNKISIDAWYEALRYPEAAKKNHQYIHQELFYGGLNTLEFWRSNGEAAREIREETVKLARSLGIDK